VALPLPKNLTPAAGLPGFGPSGRAGDPQLISHTFLTLCRPICIRPQVCRQFNTSEIVSRDENPSRAGGVDELGENNIEEVVMACALNMREHRREHFVNRMHERC